MTKRNHVLIVDDDTILTELVKKYLQEYDFEVDVAREATEARTILQKSPADLILLDVMLPGQSGFEFCQELRRTSDVHILMMTARGSINDRVIGLEIGADDYLAKPFEPRELLARVQALLRRGRFIEEPRILKFEGLNIDLSARTAESKGENIALTTAEFELLSLFVNRPNEILSRDQISLRLRGTEWEALSRSVDVVMSRLRQKLGDDLKHPMFFKTIWGTGYMFIARPVHV